MNLKNHSDDDDDDDQIKKHNTYKNDDDGDKFTNARKILDICITSWPKTKEFNYFFLQIIHENWYKHKTPTTLERHKWTEKKEDIIRIITTLRVQWRVFFKRTNTKKSRAKENQINK